ncbi:MBL fold metallo-hydrolase [Amnibacterium sp.]|uniref:MBL fold metallo-hydrolase n=1 Tax=Amnibacterium sp. TaxID=1872496 RepID=UPI00260E0A96|nr:MBL fold metallo-hydrolase [Amnibacterium sp.]MCU1474642.1 fold metallo-hydrolase [Amnibacterium sp.]
MLKQVAEGVLIHESTFCRSSTVVVDGDAGVLLIDAGILGDELACLAQDLGDTGRTVVAGFSTHPHWDHLLWHAALGCAPRYGTAGCAETIRARLASPGFAARVAGMIPSDIVARVPLDLLGLLTGLPADATRIPWDGPEVRIVEHRAHAPGHAALLIEERGVLVAGDMLSDVLIPMLDPAAADPLADHLAALQLLESVTGGVEVLIPGHGSTGGTGSALDRIEQDRAYLHALQDDRVPDDPRIGPSAVFDWVADVHERQRQGLARSRGLPG